MKILRLVLTVLTLGLNVWVEYLKKQKQAKLEQQNEDLQKDPLEFFDTHFGADGTERLLSTQNDTGASSEAPKATSDTNPLP